MISGRQYTICRAIAVTECQCSLLNRALGHVAGGFAHSMTTAHSMRTRSGSQCSARCLRRAGCSVQHALACVIMIAIIIITGIMRWRAALTVRGSHAPDTVTPLRPPRLPYASAVLLQGVSTDIGYAAAKGE
eukprot:3706536-Rhodomonas_salina.1